MQLFGLSRNRGQQQPQPEAAAPAPAGDDAIKDATTQTFAADVVEASMTTPVLVDFWAPWCGPCKQLTPVLEKVVRQAKGKVKLVKVNADENQQLAAQLGVQSLPTVIIAMGGRLMQGFTGALPESQIKALVEQLTGGPVGADLAQGLDAAKAALDEGRAEEAAAIFAQVLQEDPANPEAYGGLARAMIAQNLLDDAREVLDNVPPESSNAAPVTGAKAALQLASEAGSLTPAPELEARLERDPDDHEARSELATQLFLRGKAEDAFAQLMTIIRKDREWRDDGARKQMVKLFEALGPTHPLTLKGRRMLSTVLFS